MTTTHAPKTIANIFQSRRSSTASSSSKWHPSYTRPKAPVKYAPAYGSSSSSSLMRNINRMKRPSYQCRTGIHGPNRLVKDQLGPGPNKLKIGPTQTGTINFQRAWTNSDQTTGPDSLTDSDRSVDLWCRRLIVPENGYVIGRKDCTNLNGKRTPSTTCKFSCNAGFSLIGQSALRCGPRGWNGSSPRCKKATCHSLNAGEGMGQKYDHDWKYSILRMKVYDHKN